MAGPVTSLDTSFCRAAPRHGSGRSGPSGAPSAVNHQTLHTVNALLHFRQKKQQQTNEKGTAAPKQVFEDKEVP